MTLTRRGASWIERLKKEGSVRLFLEKEPYLSKYMGCLERGI
jgi:hypothetical protein